MLVMFSLGGLERRLRRLREEIIDRCIGTEYWRLVWIETSRDEEA